MFAHYAHVEPLTLPLKLACVGTAFLLAYISLIFVEQPFRDKRRIGRTPIFASGAAAMAVICGVGVGLGKTDGMPERVPGEFLALIDKESKYYALRNACHFITPERAIRKDLCIRGAEGVDPSFILVGDSHADALSPAIFTAAEELNLSGYQYTNSGFRPLLGVEKQGDPDWGAQARALVIFLEAHPSVETVYLTGFWEYQATGYSFRGGGHTFRDEHYDGTRTRYNATAMKNGLSRLAQTFPDRRFIILDDVPSGHEMDPERHVRNAMFSSDKHYLDAGIHRDDAERQRAKYEPILVDLAHRHDNLEYRPVLAAHCIEDHCPLFDNGKALYRDGDHLSEDGALRLTPIIREHVLIN